MLEVEEHPVLSRELIIRQCYEEVFPVAASYIRRQDGTLDEAKEVFQLALVAYYEKHLVHGFEPDRNHQAYLMGIFKNQWLKYLERRNRTTRLSDWDQSEEKTPAVQSQRLLSFLKQSGQRCMELLQSFYYEKLPMKQLADRFGYASERSVTVQKYKCLEKVREEVKQKSLQYEDFFE